jgi:hypothetical protein
VEVKQLPSPPDFILRELGFTQGESYMFDVPADQSRTSPRTSYVAIVDGTVRVTRIQGRLVDERTVGHTSNTSQWRPEVPVPNKLFFTVLSPTHKYLCVMRKDNGIVRVSDLNLALGQEYVVPEGKFAVLALGSVMIGASAADEYQVFQEGDVLVCGQEPTLVLEITT